MPFRSLDVLKLNKENFEKNYNPIYIFIGKKKTWQQTTNFNDNKNIGLKDH